MFTKRFRLLVLLFPLVFGLQGLVLSQEGDLARLIHPEVADRLSLTDSQRSEIQKLLLARAGALASSADESAKKGVRSEFEKKILELLNPEQRLKFTAVQPQKKLMFQFSEMKWNDVLNWFAGQQDLTLIMDRIPDGTFTYSDLRSYSPSEGIDLLNSVLMTRGFTLVRREKMLVVMELSNSIPLELLPRVKLEELDQRGKFELVSVLFPLAGRPIDIVLQEVKPYLSGYGRTVPLAQGGQLLVVETAGKMRAINELIASVPLPKAAAKPPEPVPPPKPVFASYPLGNLDPTRTLETIRKLIPSEQITVDTKTGILSGYLIPDQHAAIQKMIDTMIASRQDLPSIESVAYQFTGITPKDLKEQIASLAPKAIVTVTADRLLVVASPEDQLWIRSSLKSIDIVPVENDKSTKVFDVDPASASQLETALKSFLPKSLIAGNSKSGSLIVRGSETELKTANEILEVWKKTQSMGALQLRAFPLERIGDAKWLATVQKIVPNANAWLGDEGRQLMVLANKNEILAIESTLPQLLSLLPAPDSRKLQIYTLSKSQLARRSSLSDLPPALTTIKVVDGINKQELLVWATEPQHVAFASLLEGLDQPLPMAPQTIPQSYPLTVQDSSIALQILSTEFPEAKVTIDAEGSLLTVLADEKTHPKIASRIVQFNEQLPPKVASKLETYSVRGMTAAALQVSLTPLLTKARVNLDTERNRLLVTADAKTHQAIGELVTALSEKPAVEQQKIVIAYPVAMAVPTQLKLVLDQLITGSQVIADDKLKQVVVTGTLEAQAIVKSTIDQIDRSGANRPAVEVRSYETKKLQAAILLPTLQKLWPDLQLSADTTANRIIASGSDKDLNELNGALEKLISSPDGKTQFVKTYSVAAGDMVSLATILGQIAPQAIVSSDIPSRTVTVWANEEQQTRVEQALQQISKTAQEAKVPATYLVKPTQLLAVQTSLQTLFPTIGVASVSTTGQLIVVASASQQKRVAEVIELMASGPNAADRTIKVFRIDPERVDLTSLLSGLQAVLPSQIRLEPNLVNHTLLAVGSAEDLKLVTEKIAELTEQIPALEQSQSTVYSLHYTNTLGAVTVLQTLVPKGTFVHDPASRTISATAKPKDHRKIEEFLKAYDLPKEPKTYIVKPTQTLVAQTSIKALYPLVDITSDATTGQLIVVASPEQQKQISEVVELLVSGPNAAERTIKVFRIDSERVDVVSLLSALQATLPSQIRLEPNLKNNTLLAMGSPTELALVTEKIEQLQQQLPIPDANSTAVYPLQFAGTTGALTVLKSLVPKATVIEELATKSIAATAKKQDHEKIREFLQAYDQPKKTNLETRVFRPRQPGRGLAEVLTRLMPDAVIYGSREEGVLIATATKEQLARIEAIVREYDVDITNPETRVFSIGKGNAVSLRAAIQGLSTKIVVTADTATNSLIATASHADLERVAQIVEEVEAGGGKARVSKYYPITTGEPLPLSKALDESFPKAKFAPDTVGGGLFATATAEEHVEIAKVIEDLNGQPSKLPSLKAFVLKHANPESVAMAVTSGFGRRTTAGISFSKDAKSVFVVGSRQELQVAEQLIAQLDVPKDLEDGRQMKFFALNGADGKAISTAVESLFKNSDQPVDVRFDSFKGQLFVVGKPEQLTQVDEALKQLMPPERDLEFFQLEKADPFAFKQAAEMLFVNESFNNIPSISVDGNQQQVVVRATKEQLASIRALLTQMGESPKSVGNTNIQGATGFSTGTGRLRFVPIHRKSEKLMEEVQRLWPSLRDNPINVVDPQEDSLKKGPPQEKQGTSHQSTERIGHFASLELRQESTGRIEKKQASPIIVVTGENQWTIASDDTEGLDQFTRLLGSLLNPTIEPFATAGNFSVYLLRHADAKSVQELLTEIFQPADKGKRSAVVSDIVSRVKIVADTRINGLIVSGSRPDRKVIEELLGVFDSEDLIDTLQQISPTIVQLSGASAKSVSTIISEVYKSQLSARGGRPSLDIPEGIGSEVALLLQQINAQTAGPLLTVAVDENSNSILLRGPPDLILELKAFIEKLDQNSANTPSRRVQLLRLESTNTKNIEKALKILLAK